MSSSLSLKEYLESQRQLELEAAQQYPWDPKECTFHLDVGRQHFYACKTCPSPNAICYACSIHCHTDHELVEVDAKRNIKCDCGTTRIGGDPCTLRKVGELEKPNDNKYCHNFEGRFCDCDKEYTGETMYQCRFGVACDEDWFHEDCIPVTNDITIEGNFICWKCVDAAEIEYLEELGYARAIERQIEPPTSTSKRKRRAISLVLNSESILAKSKDTRVMALIKRYPFLSQQELEYEKLDEEAGESLLDAGMKALDQLDHQVAAAGLERFQTLRDSFTEFFGSWDSSKMVTSSDVQDFLGKLKR